MKRSVLACALGLIVGGIGCSGSGGDGEVADAAGAGDLDAGPEVDARPGGGGAPDAGVSSRELVYVASFLSGIDGFEIDPASGALVAVPGSPFAAQDRFYGLATDPAGTRLYTADFGDGSVRAFRIESATGALSEVDGFAVDLEGSATAIAVDPLGRFVYVAELDLNALESALHVFGVDATTGALAPVAGSPFPIQADAIAADPSGKFLYVTGGELGIRGFAVDAAGTLTALPGSPFGAATVFGGWMAFHPEGTSLYNARNAIGGFAIDAESGALTALAGSPFAPGAAGDPGAIGLAVDARGRFVSVVDFPGGKVSVHAIEAGGGLAEVAGSPVAVPAAYSVAIDPDGRFLYVVTDGLGIEAFAIDGETFALSRVTGSPFPASRLQPEIVIVRAPEARPAAE